MNNAVIHHCSSVLALAASALIMSAPAVAQDTTASATSTDDNAIVVTARRREERLTDVPAALSVVNVEQLKAKGIVNPTDLVHAVPSLQQSSSGFGNATPHFLIRGQRQQLEFIQSDQSVGVYVDEIAVPRQHGLNGALFDMANVQVLKGPQGTLFGKNQTGGAILFTSQMPKRDFGGYISATIGNYNARRFEGAINVPVTDSLQIRAAGLVNRRDGYMHNVTDGRNYNDAHSDAWRVSAHWSPGTGTVDNWLIVAGSKQDEIGNMPKSLVGPGGTRLPGNATEAATWVSSMNLFSLLSGGANTVMDQTLLNATQRQAAALGKYEVGGVSQFQLANGNNVEIATFNVTNKTEFHLGDNLTLRNIFGYRFMRSYVSANDNGVAGVLLTGDVGGTKVSAVNAGVSAAGSGLPGAVILNANGTNDAGNDVPQSGINCVVANGIEAMNFTKQRQISDEVNLLGKALDDKLDFILGAYYFREHGQVVTNNWTPISLGSRNGVAQNEPANESHALFGQATFHVTPTVSITGGLRQTWDHRETNAQSVTLLTNYWPWKGTLIPADGVTGTCSLLVDTTQPDATNLATGNQSATQFLPNGSCLLSGKANFHQLTYTASIDWHPTRDTLLYAITRKGYRSGGFNQSATTQQAFPHVIVNRARTAFVTAPASTGVLTPFQPETVTDYEIGFKGNWRWGNGMSAGFNIDYYHNNYNNIQRALASAAGNKSVTANAAQATIEGVEVEARFEPTNWLELSGYYSKIRPKFKSFVVSDTVLYAASAIGDFTKSKFSGVPTDSGGAAITLHTELPNDMGRIAATMDYYGQTGSWMQDNNWSAAFGVYTTAPEYIPGYWLLGANLSWTGVMGKPLDLSANVRNLNNQYYYTGGIDGVGSGAGPSTRFVGEPRMYTFSLTYHF